MSKSSLARPLALLTTAAIAACAPAPSAGPDARTSDADTRPDAPAATDAPAIIEDAPAGDSVAPADAALDAGSDAGSDAAPAAEYVRVLAGEYVTSYLRDGQVYSVAGTAYRRGSGDHPPDAVFPPARVAFPAGVRIVEGAGGLHFTIAADADGHVWEWGDIEANPALAMSNVPVQLMAADARPLVLNDAAGHTVRSMAANAVASAAVGGDGSVWVWDDCRHGLQGDGTEGDAHVLRPVRVPLPDGTRITKIVLGDVMLALDEEGGVWAWGSTAVENLGTRDADYRRPRRITQTSTGAPMPRVTDIATGQSFSYAISAAGDLYAWGVYGEIAGLCPGSGWCPADRPALANQLVAAATRGGARVASIYANTAASYAVMTDGTLWAWGSNGQGLVGNGVAPDYSMTTPPYTWNWDKDALLVTSAVRIAPDVSDFVRVYTGTADVFYAYAQTRSGRLFSWGRNKTGCLGSGVVPLNSQQAATYPNSWDVTTPTEVTPLTATQRPVSSPHCTRTPSAGSCWCGSGPSSPQNC